MLDSLLARTKRTRNLPLWARLTGAAVLAGAFAGARVSSPFLPAYPVLLGLCAILANAILFGRGPGYLTLAVWDLFAIFVYLPHAGLAVQRSADMVGLLVFSAIGLFCTATVAALQTTFDQLLVLRSEFRRSDDGLEAAERAQILVREAGHRIKNNLTTLIGVLRAQQRTSEEPAVQSALGAAADRIQVFARVHDRLQASDPQAQVDLPDFLAGLCEDLRGAVIGLRPVGLVLDAAPALLTQSKAIAVGLCVNEMVTNALKHGFPNDQAEGVVRVVFRQEGDAFLLSVDDDGLGVPPMAVSRPNGIGSLLVRAMAAQLSGSFTLGPSPRGPGAAATFRFPADAQIPAERV